MTAAVYRLDPPSRSVPDATVSGSLQRAADGSWELSLGIMRAADQPALDAAAVAAAMADSTGRSLTLSQSPAGPLPEGGSSLGMSANARFRFQDHGAPPASLMVRLQGAELRFRLLPD